MAKKAFIPLDVVQIMMEYLLDFAASSGAVQCHFDGTRRSRKLLCS
jgi:hypothetical protein